MMKFWVLLASLAVAAAYCSNAVASSYGGVGDIITPSLFEEMLPHRNDAACPARGFYTYEAFIAAADSFPGFGTAGGLDTRKRELAAFFGQTSHETTSGWARSPGGPYVWGYCYKEEIYPRDYCIPDYPHCPCEPGKQYYGRGPIQLSINYNYCHAGAALGVDLRRDPDLLASDPTLSFRAALWFWMTPQAPKPSCHDVITGVWAPSAVDLDGGRVPGYGLVTNIINGRLECGHRSDDNVQDRIGFYKRYCGLLGVTYGENLDCGLQQPFAMTMLVSHK